MPTATRTFRVFVSSTFEDLRAERDALQRDVFPKLRQLCEENGARFQAIDLRWGVRDEAALDQQTMEICLREIERCQQTGIKPNFIVLLGDRYGWRPLPARIDAQEFDKVCSRVADAADRQLINAWYERDDNAVPPEYLLKPRTGEFVDRDRWGEIEHKLHRILQEAARDAALAEGKLIKYEVSATHQEILKGLGEKAEDRKHVFAFFREPAPGVEEDLDLRTLKQDLRNKLDNENICPFRASDSAKLCTDVEKLLSEVILAEVGKFKSRPALDLEIEAHEAFARDRARHFRGRKSVLDAIDKHIRGGDSRPLVVHGASGCGKSAIVAKASAQAKAEIPGAVLIQRFIGVTPDSSNGLTLLHSLCEQLSHEYGATEETPLGLQPLVVAFHERMARATAERPLVLFLDALDQLRSDDEARSFAWLRQILPPHVSFVVSTTEIPAGLESPTQVAVEDFPVSEAEQVLAAWLQDAHRKLEPEQREKVLSGFAPSGLPLYLKLAFEEARRWRSFQAAVTCVLGNGVGGMIDVLFARLSGEANHGRIMVNRSLGFLAAARYGLTENEILDVLAADEAVWKDFESRAHHTPPARRLPVIVWSRLFLDLEPYLNERAVPGGNLMAFYHRQVAECAAALYLQQDEGRLRHAELAQYFKRQSGSATRKLEELPWQYAKANLFDDLEKTLTDIDMFLGLSDLNRYDIWSYWQAMPQGRRSFVNAYKDAVEQWKKTLGETSRFELALNELQHFLFAVEEHQEGARFAQMSYDVAKTLYSDSDIRLAVRTNNKAGALCEEGKYLEALSLLLKVRPIYKRHFQLYEESRWAVENNIADCLFHLCRFEEAEELYRQTIDDERRYLGDHNPGTLQTIVNFAIFLQCCGKFSEATPWFEAAASGSIASLGKDQPATKQRIKFLKDHVADFVQRDSTTALITLAYHLAARGIKSEAIRRYREVLESLEGNAQANHVKIAYCVQNLMSLDSEALAAAREIMRQLIPHLENTKDELLLKLKNRFESRPDVLLGKLGLASARAVMEHIILHPETAEDVELLMKCKNKLGLLKLEGEKERDQLARRQDAADRILGGDYSGAEALLRGLLQDKFALPSTHCHLARVLLMTDRDAEARQEIKQAWATREEAPTYVVPRILFFRCVFALLDGADTTPIVGQIKAALRAPDAHLDWTIQPMLNHLRSRLGETNYQFLKVLAEGLGDASAMPHLDKFPQWLNAAAASSSSWIRISMRVLAMTFLSTLLSFAVGLLLSITGAVVYARAKHVAPNLTFAYRHIAFPFAVAVGAIVLVWSLAMETWNYRERKMREENERTS